MSSTGELESITTILGGYFLGSAGQIRISLFYPCTKSKIRTGIILSFVVYAPHWGCSANETHYHLQSLESVGTTSTGTLLDQRKRLDERALEKEEEDYFNEDRWVSIRLRVVYVGTKGHYC